MANNNWRYRIMVSTQDFHSCNRGSIPRSAAKKEFPYGVYFFDLKWFLWQVINICHISKNLKT
jgi:hypothetical protein